MKIEQKRISQFEPYFGKEEIEEIAKVIESGWVIEHAKTREFEKMFAEYVGAKYAIATTSGTSSLFLALAALKVGHGDEVIIPAYTFVATANAVRLAGAKPVFVDVLRNDANIDPSEVSKHIADKTKAIIPVHINGRPADVISVKEIAEKHSIHVVEDAAQTLGSRLNGKHLGTFSKMGCFSLATTKHLTTGQGGMIVTNDEELYERVAKLKDHGRTDRLKLKKLQDYYDEIGYNFKFTDLQAALGIAQFRKLEWRVNRIKQMYKLYKELLKGKVHFMPLEDGVSPWYIDPIFHDPLTRESVIERLQQHNIETRRFYKPLHQQPLYATQGDFADAEYLSERGLWLPSTTFLTDEDIQYVCDKIKEAMS